MDKHVAVLRELRDAKYWAGGAGFVPALSESQRAAIDHAIALDAEARKLAETAMEAAKKMDNMREQHAALVARLGELEKAWRDWGNNPDHPTFGMDVNTAATKTACADDLARVYLPKENESERNSDPPL